MPNITIPTSTVLTKVKRMASIVGRNAQKDTPYSSIIITDQDEPIIEGYIEEAKNNVISTFAERSSYASQVITIVQPAGFNSNLSDTISSEVQLYMSYYAVAQWFSIVLPSVCEKYAKMADAHLLVARSCYLIKEKPTKTIEE